MFLDRVRSVARRVWAVVRRTYAQWRRHRTIRLGAGLAYYGLFALIPLLAIGIAIAGLVISESDIQSYVEDQLTALLGVDADVVSDALAGVLDGAGTLSSLGVAGAVSLVLTASVLVIALQDALNTIWERPVRSGIRHSVLRRVVAFVVVAGVVVAIIVSFTFNSVTGLLGRLAPDLAIVVSLQELVGLAGSWALAIGVVTLLFRYLTDVRVPWRAALVGGVVTAAMLALGTSLVGAYLRRYAASSIVGVAGSVLLVLLWIYYEAQILLAGAEFTRVVALSVGDDGQSGVGPRDDAAIDVNG